MADTVSTPFGDIPSFIFGGNTGIPSYAELQRRRAIMEARARGQAGRAYPKTLGEGIAALGEGLGDRFENQRLAAGEKEFETAEDARLGGIRAAPGVGAGPVRTSALDPAVEAQRQSMTAAIVGGPGGAAGNPTVAAGDTSPQEPILTTGGIPADEGIWARRAAAISGIESGGRRDPYQVLGAVTPRGDRAYGKYQVMGANIPEWTQEALGQRLTPQQFLANKDAQEAVFRKRFGDYADRYGDEGAARAWYAGEKGMKNLGATDQHGRLTVGGYGQDVMRRLQGARGAPAGVPEVDDGAGETVTHIPEPGENPVTPTEIRPAPAAVSGAPVITPAPRADTLPSMTPVPSAKKQTMDDPGPEPAPPARIDFSPRQQKALEVMQSRAASDHGKAFAKQQFEIEEKIRTELMTRREADYVNKRERWEKLKDAKLKFDREEHDRDIEQLLKRGQVEEANAKAEEYYYKRGIPRTQAEQKGALDIQQAQRNLSEPKSVTMQGTQWERNYNPATGSWGPFGVAPGAPTPEGKPLTEKQVEGVQFVVRTATDLDKLERDLNHGKVMTQWLEAARGNVPFVSKITRSEEYAKASNAVNNFAGAFLKFTSGTAITPSEAALQLPAFVPQANDSDAELKEKTRRRREFFNAVKGTTGVGGIETAEKVIRQNAAEHDVSKLPPIQVKSPEEAKALPPGRWFITETGEKRQRSR